MSDDAHRPTHGNAPDQRHGRGAPAWWEELARADLPDDPGRQPTIRATRRPEPPAAMAAATGPARPRRFHSLRAHWRNMLVTTLVVVIAALAVCVAFGVTSPRDAVAAVIIFGVPASLALLVASLVMRYAGR